MEHEARGREEEEEEPHNMEQHSNGTEEEGKSKQAGDEGEQSKEKAARGGAKMAEEKTERQAAAVAPLLSSSPTHERQHTTRTPPLPSAWTVKSFITAPIVPGFVLDEDKEMPALDPRRVDAAGMNTS